MIYRKSLSKDGFRSKFEKKVAEDLTSQGIDWSYESEVWEYYIKVRKGNCEECGSNDVYQLREYTPDFILPDLGIVLEVKGKFTSKDRSKHLALQKEYPDVDLRFVFMRDNWLTSTHKQRYSDWCISNGFNYSIGKFNG